MSAVSDDVFHGLRCAVCEQPFDLRAGEIGVAVAGRAERIHDDAPEGCPNRDGEAQSRAAHNAAVRADEDDAETQGADDGWVRVRSDAPARDEGECDRCEHPHPQHLPYGAGCVAPCCVCPDYVPWGASS